MEPLQITGERNLHLPFENSMSKDIRHCKLHDIR